MKLTKKLIILIFFLFIFVTSMVTGVLAWTAEDDLARIRQIGSQVESDNTVDIKLDQSELFLGDRVRDLVYLSNSDFNKSGLDFYGYASLIKINLQNSGDLDSRVHVGLNAQDASEYGQYNGTNSSYKYLVLTNPSDLIPKMHSFQNSLSNIFTEMTNHNNRGVLIEANTTQTVYIYIWGYYDGLSQQQKAIYHAIIYRMRVIII